MLRKVVLITIVVAVIVSVCLLILHTRQHRLTLRTYLRSAVGITQGTRVLVDGVEAGRVRAVNVSPELGNQPVELILELRASDKLSIPAGSVAELLAEGVLGPNVIEIDTTAAQGPPLKDNSVLQSSEVTSDQAAHAMEAIGKALTDAAKRAQDKEKPDSAPRPTK